MKMTNKTQTTITDEARELTISILRNICFAEKSNKPYSIAQSALDRSYNQALDNACDVVFGQCSSDNVAQRTVKAIRELKLGV